MKINNKNINVWVADVSIVSWAIAVRGKKNTKTLYFLYYADERKSLWNAVYESNSKYDWVSGFDCDTKKRVEYIVMGIEIACNSHVWDASIKLTEDQISRVEFLDGYIKKNNL